jgi:hypothetical protein
MMSDWIKGPLNDMMVSASLMLERSSEKVVINMRDRDKYGYERNLTLIVHRKVEEGENEPARRVDEDL